MGQTIGVLDCIYENMLEKYGPWQRRVLMVGLDNAGQFISHALCNVFHRFLDLYPYLVRASLTDSLFSRCISSSRKDNSAVYSEVSERREACTSCSEHNGVQRRNGTAPRHNV